MKLKNLRLPVAAALSAGLIAAAGAAGAGTAKIAPDLSAHYKRVAEFKVLDGRSRDVVKLSKADLYSEARFCVSFASVEFRKVKASYVKFKKADREKNLRVRRIVSSGDCSRPISLVSKNGQPRALKKIELDYSSYVKSGVQPVVAVYLR